MDKLKNIIKTALLLMACVFTAACNKDDNPFVGDDNHLVAFSVTLNDGTKYTATLQGNDIILTVPEGVDLTGAKAEYQLCENAVIVPDPSEITMWNDEQIFRVEAYNNEYTSYKYKVTRTGIYEEGTIVLATQAEVDAFGEKGITVLKGNLIIGSNVEPSVPYDTIKSISSLSSLQEVTMNVIVNDTYKGNELFGFSNLKKVGTLYVGMTDKVANLQSDFEVSLPNLESANDIYIVSDSVKKVELDKLVRVNKSLYVRSMNLAEFSLQSMVNCSGSLSVIGLSGTSSSVSATTANQTLTDLKFNKLESVNGDFTIKALWGAKNLKLPLLKSVGGAFTIDELRYITEIKLPALTVVGGAFASTSNDAMTTFSAPSFAETGAFTLKGYNQYVLSLTKLDIPELAICHGAFSVSNGSIENLIIPKLRIVERGLSFTQMQFTESIEVPALEVVGDITLNSLNLIKEFDASKAKQHSNIAINVTISGCAALERVKLPAVITQLNLTDAKTSTSGELIKIENVEEVTSRMSITASKFSKIVVPAIRKINSISISASSTTSIEFPATDSIGTFNLQNYNKLTTLNAPELTKCQSFTIQRCAKLENLNFPKLKTVNEKFKLEGTSTAVLTSLDAFSALEYANEVEIKNWGNLVDFTGIKGVISNITESAWNVSGNKYNPTYEDMVNGNYVQNN